MIRNQNLEQKPSKRGVTTNCLVKQWLSATPSNIWQCLASSTFIKNEPPLAPYICILPRCTYQLTCASYQDSDVDLADTEDIRISTSAYVHICNHMLRVSPIIH